jgi:hypothetical protein
MDGKNVDRRTIARNIEETKPHYDELYTRTPNSYGRKEK